jgi:uncharacterized protein (TIGR02466 family)
MTTSVNIQPLFPSAIGFTNLGRDLTTLEMKTLLELEQRPNEGNNTSKNHQVLSLPALKNLKSFMNTALLDYYQQVYQPRFDVRPYITLSWTNYTTPGQFHHKHAHPNSFVSAVFYIKTNPETDRIFFYKDGYNQLDIPPSDWNSYNSKSWWFSAHPGQLILFPSGLSHMVEPVQGEDTRVSLSFNTFLQGTLGDEKELTKLSL